MAEGDRTRGLYRKYEVYRCRWVDGLTFPVEKSVVTEPCFVLKYGSDPHAAVALQAYAESCAKDFPDLSKDLLAELRKYAGD